MSHTPNEISSTEDFEFAALQKAENYRTALIWEFSSYLKGQVLEIGAGIGQITTGLKTLPQITKLVSVEPEARFCKRFRELHPDCSLVEGTIDSVPADSQWDAIVSINVLEHIREDASELSKYRRQLSVRQGHLCLFVPARQEIYAPLDQDFGHYRRYSRPQLAGKLREAGFRIVHLNYFNMAGYFAWWLNFCILRRRKFDTGSVSFFDRAIFPATHTLEAKVFRPPFGQSLIAVVQATA